MSIQITQSDGIDVITLSGSIDSKTAPAVREELVRALGSANKVILDMQAVDYLSSAGLRLLLLAYREMTAKNGKIVLVGVSPDIQEVMSNTGFIKFFQLVDSLEQARASFE